MTKKHIMTAILFLVTAATLAILGYWAYWHFFIRYSPITITQNQKEIQALLESSGYAAANTEGPELWVITYRNCAACKVWEDTELPKFAAAGIDIRVIPYAPQDIEGKVKTTPSERSTIAEIWLNRSYALYQQWRAAPEETWQPTFRAADGDLARSAVVEASRLFVGQLEPLLGANGVPIRYPMVIWRDGEEHIKVCACSEEKMYHYVRDDLRVASKLPDTSETGETPVTEEKPTVIAPPQAETLASQAASDFGPDSF